MSAADRGFAGPVRRLPFVIEGPRGEPIALAASGAIAFAMLRAALAEYPQQSLRLRKEGETVVHRFA